MRATMRRAWGLVFLLLLCIYVPPRPLLSLRTTPGTFSEEPLRTPEKANVGLGFRALQKVSSRVWLGTTF